MNSDETPSPLQRPIDPELEVRVVAWVAGEASPFEAAELERLCTAQPELAILKRRIEAVHGLVAEAARPDPVPLRLSPERRTQLLQTIGVPETPVPEIEVLSSPKGPPLPESRDPIKRWHVALSLAASFVFIVGIAILKIPFFGARHEASKDYAALSFENQHSAAISLSESPDAEGMEVPSFGLSIVPTPSARLPEPHRSVSPTSNLAVAAEDSFEAKSNEHGVGVLSPFDVTANADVGYCAMQTLAGTRLSTPLVSPMFDSIATPQVSREAVSKGTGAYSYKAKSESSADGGKIAGEAVAARAKELADASQLADVAVLPEPAPTPPGAPAAASAAAPPGDEEVVVLSPFSISAQKKDRRSAANLERFNGRARGLVTGADKSADYAGDLPMDGFTQSAPAGRNDIVFGVVSPDAQGIAAARAKPAAKTSTAKQEDEKREGDTPLRPTPQVAAEDFSNELAAAKEPVSTFSLHVSDASFRLAQAELALGRVPAPDRIRPEEFYNAFDYGDPAPGAGEKVSCRIEQAAHPFRQQRNLVRIAMKVPATGRGAGQPLRLTVLLDTSGSMERADRAAAVRRALAVLGSLLGPNDRLTLIGFARTPRLLAEAVPGDKTGALLDLLARTPAEGGTNFEEALKLAGELARRHHLAAAQNRIVLLTDGAANLGNANPEQLAAAIDTLRQQGIAFDACGVGLEGIDDTMLEALTRKGDGRYTLLESPEAADVGFARQLAGAFRPAAQNVKVQVRFNPTRVGQYRLIGFEKHRLRTEDFRNDKVDAAELAADEAAVALYQVEPLPQGDGELGEVFVRFRDTATGQMVERSWTLRYEPAAPAFDRASPTLQLAGTAALLAEALRGGRAAAAIQLDELAPVVNALRGRYASSARVQTLATLFEQSRRLQHK